MTQAESQQASRLIHTGQVIVDLVMQIDALPAPGGDVLAHHASFEVGGGFNVMAAARRSGMRVVYPGGLGRGRFGDMARQALAQEGVEIAAPEVADRDTGVCVAIVDASAERTFVSHMGAESVLDRHVLDALSVNGNDIVYVSGYSLMLADKGAVLVDWLEELPSETRIAFDPGPLVDAIDAALLERMLAVVSIWTSNRAEALRFADTDDFNAAFDLIIARLRTGALAIVRDGALGCHLRVAEMRDHVPGFAVKAVDSNGAGDAHAGVFLAALASGAEARTAARRANAAAAIAVTRHGPATAPDAAEIDSFIASVA
ncbi:PfkB family carbohydrate kinase [Caballeronia sp. SEWSISQ10-4 2]|uniref:PfkB family carbohydrate kinase n=1 Tax=Caballeronia sp. SEWSISQ10-4 2 TaxID=2937438 RepID=UPI00264CCD23|nr:PfkB family carbohydrate kinase [Caballeronia sp. SEWSISQ10-4 2]MDN7182810.1 PfkB family carbohydrate kinase [Caballeronia sp. SEWSISQ10-4 2]